MDIGQFFSELDAMFSGGEQTDRIEAFLRSGLECAERENNLSAVISVCSEMGGFYRVRSEYDKGEAVLRRALECIDEIGMNGSSAHATTLLNLATLLTHAGRLEDAVTVFDSAAAMLESCGDGQSYTAAALHNNIASLYLRLGDTDAVMRHIEKALGLLPAESGDERGVSYTIKAQSLLKSDRLEDAEGALILAKAAFASDPTSSPLHRAVMEQTFAELLRDAEGNRKVLGEALSVIEDRLQKDDALSQNAVSSPAISDMTRMREYCLKELEKEFKI